MEGVIILILLIFWLAERGRRIDAERQNRK